MVEVDVLAFLLGCEQPPTCVELEHEIGSEPLDVSDALHNLAAADLIDLDESQVTLSRTSRVTMLMSRAIPSTRTRKRAYRELRRAAKPPAAIRLSRRTGCDLPKVTSLQPDTFRDLLYAVVTGQRNHEDSRRRSQSVAAGLRRAAERGSTAGAEPMATWISLAEPKLPPQPRRECRPPLAGFVIQVADLKAERLFYEKLLGLPVSHETDSTVTIRGWLVLERTREVARVKQNSNFLRRPQSRFT